MLKDTEKKFLEKKIKLWDQNNSRQKSFFSKNYESLISHFYKHLIPTNSQILEIGCGDGSLLEKLKPLSAVGIDISNVAIQNGLNKNYKNIDLFCFDSFVNFKLENKKSFDYIIISDLVNDLYDIDEFLKLLGNYCNENTKIIFNFFSNIWKLPRDICEKFGLCDKLEDQNWIDPYDLQNLLNLNNFEIISKKTEILFPLDDFLSKFLNKYLSKLWPFHLLNLTNFFVVRKIRPVEIEKSVSIVIPCRNEEGHIKNLINRIPQIGLKTEVIFVEGGSKDKTFDEILSCLDSRKDIEMKLIKQKGIGKGDAVRAGFEISSNEILMILDSDISVAPENLRKFYDLIKNSKGEFINGVRLVYPMENKAMRFLNLLGNKFFAHSFSWVLNQRIKDTLCGTKVLSKSNYEKIKKNRSYFGEFDPFGDFDLIFGAVKQNLKIVDLPIRYFAREYGETNISRWKHGLLLLRMLIYASKKIKFI